MEPEGSLPRLQGPATSLSWARSIHSMPPFQFPKIRLNVILSSTPGSSKWSLPSGFPTKILYAPILSPMHATCPTNPSLLDLIAGIIFGEECRSLSSSLCSFLHSPVTSSLLGPNISPQHPIFKHLQPTFLPQCEGPSFTPIQKQAKLELFIS